MTLTAQDIIQNAIDADPGLVESVGFVRYDPQTGAIAQVGIGPRSHIEQEKADGSAILQSLRLRLDEMLAFPEENYVDLATKTIRPKDPFPGTLQGTTFTNLPVPCWIAVAVPFQTGQGRWEPVVYAVQDAEIALDFELPDRYEVHVLSARFRTARFEIDTNG